MKRVQRDMLAYVLIALASVLLLIWAIPVYTPAYPGYGASPALVPNVAVSVMLVMAILAIVRSVVASRRGTTLSEEESTYPEDGSGSGFTQVGRVDIVHLAKFMISAALFVVGINTIGYIASALGFLLLLQFLVGARNPVKIVILSVVTVALMYVAMRYGFGVPIPGY